MSLRLVGRGFVVLCARAQHWRNMMRSALRSDLRGGVVNALLAKLQAPRGAIRLPSPASAERPLAASPDRLADRSRRACSSGDDRKASRPPRVREPR